MTAHKPKKFTVEVGQLARSGARLTTVEIKIDKYGDMQFNVAGGNKLRIGGHVAREIMRQLIGTYLHERP